MMRRVGCGLAFCAMLALAVRALGLDLVFLDDDGVVFSAGDAYYHAHRARFSFFHFPQVLGFDACINHPHGSPVPYPPLYDLAVGGLARALGSPSAGTAALERVAAWMPALLGALTVFPVYSLGRRLGTPIVGLSAALLLALHPLSVAASRVGNADHHAAVGLLGALLVASYTRALDARSRASVVFFAGLCATRIALLTTWQGSLLYLGPGELALTLSAALRGRRDLLFAQGLGAGLTALAVTPWIAATATPLAGPFSATELSWLHVALFAANAVICLGALIWETRRPPEGSATEVVWKRGARLAVCAGASAAAVIALPGFAEGLGPALGFLTQSDQIGATLVEQLPLFYQQGGYSLGVGLARLGIFSLLVPFAAFPFYFAAREPSLADACYYLFAWCLLTSYLTFQQVRYGNDFAPVACVSAALALAGFARLLLRARPQNRRGASLAAVLLGVVMWAPTVPLFFAPYLVPSWHYLTGGLAEGDRALASIGGTQMRFAQAVAGLTPETGGCDGSGRRPAYAILAPSNIGHALHYSAGRATPADNFGPYIGAENFRAVSNFYAADSEQRALSIAKGLGTRFVVTQEEGDASISPVFWRLHRGHGSATESAANWGRFRLLFEGPEGGLPTSALFAPTYRDVAPYRLFEIVPGALVEVPAAPGRPVEARVAMETEAGRRFTYRARGSGGPDGLARLRLPHPTEGEGPVAAKGAYHVSTGPHSWTLELTEAQIRGGARLRLEAPRTGAEEVPRSSADAAR